MKAPRSAASGGDRGLRVRAALFALIALVAAGLCYLLYSFYERSASLMRSELSGSVMNTLAQAEINIRYPLAEMIDLSTLLLANPVLREVVERPFEGTDRAQQVQDYRRLEAILSSAQSARKVERVRLFVDDRFMYAGEHVNFFGLGSIEDEPWFPEVVRRDGGVYIRDTYAEEYIDKGSVRVISFIRRIGLGDPARSDSFPVLAIDVPEAVFGAILAQPGFPQGERAYITDRGLRVISSADPGDLGKPVWALAPVPLGKEALASLSASPAGIDEAEAGGRTLTIIHRNLTEPDWSIVTILDGTKLLERNRAYGLLSGAAVLAAVVALALIAALLASAALNERMSRKIHEIARRISETGKEYFASPAFGRGELSQLERSVASLLQTVNRLMEENDRSRELAQEAKLAALQAQINPHFLYNTLDSINWMAARRGASDIAEMAISLARYFRLALSEGKEIVSLGEELELVKSYLAVQRIRFGSAFAEVYDVAPELLSLELPKLSLQPLVENALLHGLQHKRGGGGSIRIEGSMDGPAVVLRVRDDGAGMSDETLERLRGQLALGRAPHGRNFGLMNVDERIRLYCGAESGLRLDSSPGSGTCATVLLSPAGPRLASTP